jgi:hypothetical protein
LAPLESAASGIDVEALHQIDVSGPGMAVVFWKEVHRQYQLQMTSTNSIVDPVAKYVNSHTVDF